MTQHKVRRQSVRTMVQQPPAIPATQADQSPISDAQLPVTPAAPGAERDTQIPVTVSPAPASPPQEAAAKPKRSKLGWPVRDDLIKKCKQIALDESRHDYEVLEELLESALEQRAGAAQGAP